MNRRVLLTIFVLGLIGFIAVVSNTYSSKESPLRQHAVAQNDLSLNALSLDPREGGAMGPQPPSPLHVDCPLDTDDCGSVTPDPASAGIADGAYNSQDGTLFFVDVPSGSQGIFQLDPSTCDIVPGTYAAVGTGVSDRGIAYNEDTHEIYVGGWATQSVDRRSATYPYPLIANYPLGIDIAGMAIDQANDRLWVIAHDAVDEFYVYDISTGAPIFLQSFPVPWQDTSIGWDGGGLAYDDDAATGQLVAINTTGFWYGLPNTKEYFTDDWPNPPIPAGTCVLSDTGYGWGLALMEDSDSHQGTSTTWVPDVASFTPPFPIDRYGEFHCEPMLDFACEQVDGTTDVQLTWTLPADGCLTIEIYRDEVLIANINSSNTDYLDEGVTPGPHLYEIQCVCTPGSPHVFCNVWVLPVDGPCYDFDTDDGGFISEGPTPHWGWGVPSVPYIGNAWEVDLGTDYHNDDCALLRTPAFAVGPGGVVLEFLTYYDIEDYWDGFNVKVSTDLGTTWTLIHPVGGYDDEVSSGVCTEVGPGDSVFTGTSPGWTMKRFEMPSLANEPEVMFRFDFGSDGSFTETGPIIDDVCVLGGTQLPPLLELSCMILNPDENGDGEPDIYIDTPNDVLRYGLYITNNTTQTLEYGLRHEVYIWSTCDNILYAPFNPIRDYGPTCLAILGPGDTAYRAYGITIPDIGWLEFFNPYSIIVETWMCDGAGNPTMLIDQCCMDFSLTLLHTPPIVTKPPITEENVSDYLNQLNLNLEDITNEVETR